jgi:hypothetical protein
LTEELVFMSAHRTFSFLASALLSGLAACAGRAAEAVDGQGEGDRAGGVAVTHQPPWHGWSVAESANFRVFSRDSDAFAEDVLRAAERTRRGVLRKWFGTTGSDWRPRCELYVYPDAEEYAQATGAPPQAPALTKVEAEGGRVLARRIHVHGAPIDVLQAVLPHEVTHAVLAGRFGPTPVPRWADEGMAVLTEPRDRVERHLRGLPHWRDEGLLFGTRSLLELADYPPPHAWGSFYSQSVSLVDFLCREKDPQTFTRFLRDGIRDGYPRALRRYYGWSFRELEQHWRQHAFPDEGEATP